MKLNFIINALTHCNWKDCTAQLVEEVQDRHVLLVATGHTEDPYFKLKACSTNTGDDCLFLDIGEEKDVGFALLHFCRLDFKVFKSAKVMDQP